MDKEKCFYLGKITRLVGFKGEVAVFIDSDEPEKYSALETVFVDLGGKLIPFFIESINLRNKNNQLTMKFQDIDTQDDAAHLPGCELFLPIEILPPLKGNAFYFHEVPGFEVIDEAKGNIGNITQVLDYPGNPLFEIGFGNKIILIPVQDQFIIKLDRENKTIFLRAPEGLIDIYLDDQNP